MALETLRIFCKYAKNTTCKDVRHDIILWRSSMRVDKWLSAVNVVKRRTIATDMLKSGVVLINDMKAKASKDVKLGDKITIEYLKGAKHYEVLQIPKTKTIPKSQKEDYVKELS